MPTTSFCPSSEELQLVAVGEMSEWEQERLFEHLGQCDSCAHQMDALMQDGWIPKALQAPTSDYLLLVDSHVEDLMERLRNLPVGAVDQPHPTETPPTSSASPETHILMKGKETEVADQGAIPFPQCSHDEADGVPEPSPKPEFSRLGDYRLIRILGQGGMGVVYLAWDEKLKRQAALKILNPKLYVDETARLRFEKEAERAAQINSPHVATVYAAGDHEGALFIAMEYLEGVTLEERLQSHTGAVTVAEVLRFAGEALSGLKAAHEKGLIHRDITPRNLMVLKDTGQVKVLDFGLARELSVVDSITPPYVLLGTPGYLSPEQAQGDLITPRSDLFSLGVVLYRMVSGSSPFLGRTFEECRTALTRINPPLLPNLPPQLSRFIARLMSRNPTRRPADATEALHELRTIEKSLTTVPPPCRSRKALLVGVALVALFTTATLVVPQIVVLIRGPDGKVRELEITGQVSATDKATGKKTTITLELQKPTPAPKPAPKPPSAPEAGELRVGTPLVVTAYTRGYEANTGDVPHFIFAFIDKGTKGTLVEIAREHNRCCVRLENAPGKDPVWISLEFVKRR